MDDPAGPRELDLGEGTVDAVLLLGPIYCHRPVQLRAELGTAGLELVDLVAVEGMAFALSDLDERMDDPLARAAVLDAARALERVPELLGIGPHLPATAVRPAGGAPGATGPG